MHLALRGLEIELREMADRDGIVMMSNRSIASKLHIGQRQINEMITELVEEGLVHKTRGLLRINGSVTESNGSVTESNGSVTESNGSFTDARHERVRDHENHEKHEDHEKHESLFKEKKHSHGHRTGKIKPNPEDDKGFEAFWIDYPKKVGKAAVVAWWARTNPNDELLMLILDGLDKWREVWTTRGTELRWIPHPMTWLNARRWEDEPS
jgi:hypothetical protein